MNEPAVGLSTAGWTFLGVTWGTIVFFATYCLAKLLSEPKLTNSGEPAEEEIVESSPE